MLHDRFDVDLDDPAALAARGEEVCGCSGEPWLFLRPVALPEVESKGMFGRRKTKTPNWGVTVTDQAGTHGPTEWMLWLTVPDGPSAADRGVAMPAGASVDVDGGGELMVLLAAGTTPDVAVAEACRLCRALIAPEVDGPWVGVIADSNTKGYDASYGFS